jgi:sugar phosphate isomerase/epimerase
MTPFNPPIDRHRTRREFLCGAAGWAALLAARAGEAPAVRRPRLSFSSVMLSGLPIDDVCRRAAALGFEAIDLWGRFDTCEHLVEAERDLGPGGLRETLARHKLELGSFTTYSTKWDRVGFPAYADFIRDVGGGLVVRESTYAKPGADGLAPAMKAFFERLKPQIDLAARSGVVFAIENHRGALFNSLDSFKAFVDLNPDPGRVGIAIAPYHLQSASESVEEAIRIAGGQLRFFYAWQQGAGVNQLPGHGPADVAPWLKALDKAGYAGYVNPFMHGHPGPDELCAAVEISVHALRAAGER